MFPKQKCVFKSSCSFKTFRVGFSDWWWEKLQGGTPPSKPAKPPHSRSLQWLVLVLMLLIAPVVAGQFIGPAAASALSLAGTTAVAWAAQGLAILLGLGMLIGVPVWAGLKTYRFCQAMCQRGQDILDGARVPVVRRLL